MWSLEPMTSWHRLLEPSTAAAAIETAASIGDRLLAMREPDMYAASPGIAQGTLGASLLFVALAEVTGERSYADAAETLLGSAIVRTGTLEQPEISLFATPVGLGLVYAVAAGRISGHEDDGEDTDIDTFVAGMSRVTPWPGPLDLVYGLVGLGTYSLARLPRASARANLDRIVSHLAATANEDAAGVTWPFRPPGGDAYVYTADKPKGHIDLGFAHGVPGIVAFLAAAADTGVSSAVELLDPAVRWLVAQQLTPGGGAFPARVVRGHPARRSARMAWCYGDPGVAVALQAAGTALGDQGLVERAHSVALGCADRDPEVVVDAALCHGSSGLGHLLNRLGQVLGDKCLLDLARHWFGVTLDRWGPALTPDYTAAAARHGAGQPLAVTPGPGLLTGVSGVGLALLSAATDIEPWWDSVLLVRPTGSWRTLA